MADLDAVIAALELLDVSLADAERDAFRTALAAAKTKRTPAPKPAPAPKVGAGKRKG